ncbi:hypothetical protein BRD02_00790 [Halobacteriales archaeon QS_8_69_73]|nr:MAG: hypothetical protein BRD02_00790 [Halobacteriales archaeon QS_8_69_73]
MSIDIAIRDAALGADPVERRRALLAAAGLLCVTAAVAFVSELVSLSVGKLSLYGFVLLGAALAAIAAYRNSGLLICCLLILAPAVGPLAVYRGFRYVCGSGPVALPGSFTGAGAAVFWLPVTLLLGTVVFSAGVAARWTVRTARAW